MSWLSAKIPNPAVKTPNNTADPAMNQAITRVARVRRRDRESDVVCPDLSVFVL
jgi:hypothetical protein